MKEMKIEKTVELHQEFETVEDVRCFLKLDYVAEEKGIRAQGNIQLSANGIRNTLSHKIDEEIELDIFAPYEKIDPQSSFKVLLADWKSELNEDKLNLILEFAVDGLKEETEPETKTADSNQEEAGLEDLLDDQNNIREVQRYVIAQQQDSYQTIAERCHVSLSALEACNHGKPISYKSLVLLPKEE